MAQHDYVIANASGSSVRADINSMALAISSNNSGSSEPSTRYAYEFWTDTSNNVVKIRNGANNAWITLPFSITANNTVDINGGAIDGTPVGGSTASTGAFTTLTASGAATFGTVDINGGAIDGTPIGGSSANTASITTLTVTTLLSLPDGSASAPSLTNTGDTNCGLYFPTADTLSFTAAGTAQFTMADGVIAPVTDNDIDLGTSSLEFKDGYFDGTLYADAINLNGTAISSTAAEINLLDALDRGSIIYGNASGATAVLGQGTNGQVLTSDGTDISWAAAGGGGASSLDGLSDAKSAGTNFTGSLKVGSATTGTLNAAQYNTSLGLTAMDAITSADGLTAIGFASLLSNTTGSKNSALGQDSLKLNQTGIENSAFGFKCLDANVSGNYNCGFGKSTLGSNTGSNNSAFGAGAMAANVGGTDNSCFGHGSGAAITSGAHNTAVGTSSLDALTASTVPNVAVGSGALTTMTSGDGGNVACGYRTLEALTTGSGNSGLGYGAALAVTTATNNTLLGLSAGQGVTTGGDNNCMGNASGVQITTGGNNLCLGTSSGTANNPGGAIITGSNQIAIGNASSSNAHIQIDWTVASDKRDKTDVTPLDMGLGFINKLEPVTYKWDKRAKYEEGNTPDGTHKESWTDVGFLAQDVEEIEAEYGHKIDDETNLTTYTSEDKNAYGLTYAKFVPMLVKAVQELSAEVEELKIRLGDK